MPCAKSLAGASAGGLTDGEIIGIVSLLLWTLILIVSVKYVALILRADNNGEGGTLSLVALARQALPGRTVPILALGVLGMSLFFGDAVITPAISVLSAVEGLKLVTPALESFVVPIALVIIAGIFWVQHKGTGKVSSFFGPVTLVWFLVMAVLGLWHIGDQVQVLRAINPALCRGVSGRARADLAARHGLGLSGRDRGRGALRRHGAFRARPDPCRVEHGRLSGPDAQLSRARARWCFRTARRSRTRSSCSPRTGSCCRSSSLRRRRP